MNLITLDNIYLAYGSDILLDHAKLQISARERICLIGRNGAGKSSLLKIIEGTMAPDGGSVWRKPNLRMARLEQELPQHVSTTVFEYVSQGLVEIGELLTRYHELTQQLSEHSTAAQLQQLEKLQQLIQAKNGWLYERNIQTILDRLQLKPDSKVAELSGGWQRRAALAKALVMEPELLLLDEPTNHLDIEAIEWLENELINSNVGLVFITHDRSLLQRLATRIIELDRGHLTSWPGDYENFLRRKEEMLLAEEKQNALFDKRLAQEEKWIRQGIKARRTRNEGRVRALEAMRNERAKRRELQGTVSFNVSQAEKSGQLVIEAKDINQQYNNQRVIQDFSLRVLRGDRIGLIGPNGVGKSTLLNILLKNNEPQQGTVTHGTKLKIAYFDQLRGALDLEKSVIENVGHGSDFIEINGKNRHIISYLADFLFTSERALSPAKALSGGECNRLLLARLFSQPANLLVLDEPTNDLDIETLELLEELLQNYQGTLLIVSHDRAFLDNVVTSTLVFEGNGKIQEFIGGYQDWLRQRKLVSAPAVTTKAEKTKNEMPKQRTKLSYKEQKELDELPKKIETLEGQLQNLQQLSSSSEFYQNDQATVAKTLSDLKQTESDLELAYQRWQELEKK